MKKTDMRIGDTVKVIKNPSVDWMRDYTDETFEVEDFLGETAVKVKMVDTDSEWIWYAGIDNFILIDDEITNYSSAEKPDNERKTLTSDGISAIVETESDEPTEGS